MNRIYALVVCLLTLLSNISFASTLHVPTDYTTIQEAINNALNGDTILVAQGNYDEALTINKPISLKSLEEAESTTIGIDQTHYITDRQVTVEGVTIGPLQIMANASFCTIKNNNLVGGISVDSNISTTISGNRVSTSSIGILLSDGGHSKVFKNDIVQCDIGISLAGVTYDNLIKGNTIRNCKTGIWNEFYSNEITANIIDSNTVGVSFLEQSEYSYYYSLIVFKKNILIWNQIAVDWPDEFTQAKKDLYYADNYFESNSQPPVSNVALGKPTVQSSNNFGTDGSEAVDGNTIGDFSQGSVTCTHPDLEPYWQLDLEGMYDIERINIYNRTDCCSERLTNFYIEHSFDGTNWFTLLHRNGPVGNVLNLDLNITVSRYFRIRLDHQDFLSLAEVEIYGRPNN